MNIVVTETGFRLEVRGSCVAAVDASQGIIEITTRQGGLRSYGASRAGVAAAVTTVDNIVEWQRRTGGSSAVEPTDHRSRLLEALHRSAAPRVPEIGRVVSAVAAERDTPLVFSRALLRARYFVDDVLRFRAAAIAAAHVEELMDTTEHVDVVDALSPKLERWRQLFAPYGRVNRAVHKTLAELPDDELSGDDLWALARVRLERPVKSALHMKILAERSRVVGKHRQEHLSMIQHAEHDELLELRSRVAEALQQEDVSEDEGNHLLAEAIANGGAREHDERLGRLVQRSLIDGTPLREGPLCPTPTAPPPIPPPPGARHLSTVGELVQEGVSMGHCVGTHSARAVAGDCFVFHIDVDGQPVTVEVDALGHVVDAAGRHNEKTAAVLKARSVFSEWGEQFPDRTTST